MSFMDDDEAFADPEPGSERRDREGRRSRLRSSRTRRERTPRPPRERGGADGGRPPRRPREPRGGGGAGGAAAILRTPAAKIGIVVLLLVLLVVVLARVISGCQRDELVDAYRDYLDNGAGQVATESAAQGEALLTVLANAQRRNPPALQTEVRKIGAQARALVTRAEELDPPGSLDAAHNSLVSVFTYRVNGINALAEVLPGVISSRDTATSGAIIARPMQRLLASDVIYDDQFAEPVRAALGDDDVEGVMVPESVFLPDTSQNLASPLGARRLLPGLMRQPGSGDEDAPQGQGNAHGTALVSTVALPTQTQLSTGGTTQVPSSDALMWQVTVENQGDFQETNVVVRVTFTASDSPGSPDSKEASIPTIAPGDEAVIEIDGPSNPSFEQATLKVEVVMVPGERRLENNSADYPIQITF